MKKDNFFLQSGNKKRKPKEKEIELKSSSESEGENDVKSASEDEFVKETPAQKRLRLAKLYLEKVQEDVEDGKF
jgi:hypothetical protein